MNWSYRFASPINYWETDAGGQAFLTFKLALNLVLLAYLSYTYWPIVRQRWPRNM